MKDYFVDLHIHIGRTSKGKPVKITASRDLTFSNIIEEASQRKGMDMIGIIDMHSPEVLEEVDQLLSTGALAQLPEGGLKYKSTVIIMGSELELRFEKVGGTAHFLVFFPYLEEMKAFSAWLGQRVKNITLSTQRVYTTMEELQDRVSLGNGLLIPAHVFTPFKSIFGNCGGSLAEFMDPSRVAAIELGLSADSEMADRLSELYTKTFLTNSDAHSLAKIAREYQKIRMHQCDFEELRKALWREEGRQVTANYGLHPKLGKYHLTRCSTCEELVRDASSGRCPFCGHVKLIKGVFNRLEEIADSKAAIHPTHRPPYIHQVPLEFIPGIGARKIQELLLRLGTEMKVLHEADEESLTAIVGEKIAKLILQNRDGVIDVLEGGGGKYGKIVLS
ncbi:endonuclease Q family protein [Ammoniphilus sp. YIM 78166]|uniref:endonuclease Q family protein n=1 Tax=Ammoniphilus sp. YIM 78166 TaxID=1644106 RepID=UPI0010703CCE|nr:endonuclease Q family protein [Ammoniphilus sp. YIM 78166]